MSKNTDFYNEAGILYVPITKRSEAPKGMTVYRYRWHHVKSGTQGTRMIAIESHRKYALEALLLHWTNQHWLFIPA